MHGYYEFIGKMGANSLTSGLRGPTNIEFADGTKIVFNAPDFRLGGTVMGERTVECVSSTVYHDLTNSIKAVVLLNTYKEEGLFTKQITGNRTEI